MGQVSKGTTGRRVRDLPELKQACFDRRAVIVPTGHNWNRPTPAAVMINQCGTILLRLFDLGMYIYEKPKKPTGPQPRVGHPPTICDRCSKPLWFMSVSGMRFYALTADGLARYWWAFCTDCGKRFKFETLNPNGDRDSRPEEVTK